MVLDTACRRKSVSERTHAAAFDGAGQKTEGWAGKTRLARHIGGYDESTVDITDAAANQKTVPIAIFCDNSRDLEMIPSSLSDFNLYGGLYRYVNLVHVSAERDSHFSLDKASTHSFSHVGTRMRRVSTS